MKLDDVVRGGLELHVVDFDAYETGIWTLAQRALSSNL